MGINLMCDLDLKHSCNTPGELVRNYYRLQGRLQERNNIIDEIIQFCDNTHAWVDRCDCWMYIKMLKDNQND